MLGVANGMTIRQVTSMYRRHHHRTGRERYPAGQSLAIATARTNRGRLMRCGGTGRGAKKRINEGHCDLCADQPMAPTSGKPGKSGVSANPISCDSRKSRSNLRKLVG
jgi:hypothetical protein